MPLYTDMIMDNFEDYANHHEDDGVIKLQNMPEDHPYMSLYRRSNMFFCVGQGAWEDELLADTRKLDGVLHAKGIPAFVDYWGYDVAHDWNWWQKQAPYFLGKIL